MVQITVKQARRSIGYTQKEMADKLGISQATYLKKERDVGQFKLGELVTICGITGVAFKDLILPQDLINVTEEES